MVKEHIKRCSVSPSVREMQTKITARYHLTPVRMALIKSLYANAGEGVEKREPLVGWWDHRSVQPLWKPVCKFLKN